MENMKLPCAIMTCSGEKITYHYKTITDPKTSPSRRTFWNAYRLTVYRYHTSRNFAHHAPVAKIESSLINLYGQSKH